MDDVASTLRISVADLRQAAEILLDHLEEVEGDVVELPDQMFWSVPADVRYDVYEKPAELGIGQLSESLEHLASVTDARSDAVAYGLVWLADILKAVGERTIG